MCKPNIPGTKDFNTMLRDFHRKEIITKYNDKLRFEMFTDRFKMYINSTNRGK